MDMKTARYNKTKFDLSISLVSIVCIMFLSGCLNIPLGNKPIVILDPVQDTISVGNIVLLNAAKSDFAGGDTLIYIWDADLDNPVKFRMGNKEKVYLGFVNEGTYNFNLTISNGNFQSKTEKIKINVVSTQSELKTILDPSLEVQIRYNISKNIDRITNEDLLHVDSVMLFVNTKSKIQSLNGIENCRNIRFLSLWNQNVSEITQINRLSNLVELSLSQNWNVVDVSPLNNLSNLKKLDLQSNSINDITALGTLVNLEYLNVMENPINNFSPLANLVKLKELWIDYSNCDEIEFVRELDSLSLFWMTVCGIHDISSLENKHSIKRLNLDRNSISEIGILENLLNLETVYLGYNNIEDVSSLEGLVNINHLRLVDNNIQDIKPLVNNSGLTEGDCLEIGSNPLSEKSLNEYIPSLIARGVKVYY